MEKEMATTPVFLLVPPGSSIHGISQARILEWLPSPPPGDLSASPMSPALASRFFTTEPSGKPHSRLMFLVIRWKSGLLT